MHARPTRIADCAEVLPGCSLDVCATHEARGSHQVILGKHLSVLGMDYRYRPEHELRITPRGKIKNYSVKAGDVLLVSRGLKNQAILVKAVPKRTIASATFYLLRMRHGVDAAYLAWCLNQAPIQAKIRRVRTGAGTPIIQRRLLMEIMIPLPSRENQRRIARIGESMRKERMLRQTLMERAAKLHHSIGRRLIDNLS